MAATSASTQRRFGINDLAPLDGGVTSVHSKIIGNFTVVIHIEDGNVSELTDFERADVFVAGEGDFLATEVVKRFLDNGMSVVVGGGWSLPLGYPNFSTTWIEMIGTEGAVMVDDSHRDVVINTMAKGMQLPMSTMRPARSATGRNSRGASSPRVGCCQRTSASTPVIAPVENSMIGW